MEENKKKGKNEMVKNKEEREKIKGKEKNLHKEPNKTQPNRKRVTNQTKRNKSSKIPLVFTVLWECCGKIESKVTRHSEEKRKFY